MEDLIKKRAIVKSGGKIDPNQVSEEVFLFNPDGTPYEPGIVTGEIPAPPTNGTKHLVTVDEVMSWEDLEVPEPPQSGTKVLTSIDGSIDWEDPPAGSGVSVIWAMALLPNDAPVDDATFQSVPSGTYMVMPAEATVSTPGIYRSNGSTELDLIISGELDSAMMIYVKLSGDDWNGFKSNASEINGIMILPEGFNLDSDSAGDYVFELTKFN